MYAHGNTVVSAPVAYGPPSVVRVAPSVVRAPYAAGVEDRAAVLPSSLGSFVLITTLATLWRSYDIPPRLKLMYELVEGVVAVAPVHVA